jgi:CNT family concentrative nucleoside transporter|tara:strand:+ start:8467 stop:9750 length:1284 start_codon:yes stop_codon:yes gene_type:complete
MGAVLIVTVAWTLSTERSKISWRLVAWGLVLQFAFAGLVLQTPLGVAFFDWVNGLVSALLTYAEEGGRFIFGNLVSNNVPVGVIEGGQGFTETPGTVARTGAFFAFRIFPNIIFVSCLMTVLYHLGVMQRIVQLLAWIMQRTLRTSGAETLCAASNIFVGLMESPLLVKPFIRGMTESELMAVMTVGMATISGGVLAAYAGMMAPFYPAAAGHLIAASVMSAPAAFVIAKLLVPETGKPETLGVLDVEVQGEKPDVNVIDAAARGAAEGLKLALVVGAMLIAFIALVALANGVVGWAGSLAGFDGLSIEGMLGWVLAPVAWLLGVTWVDAGVIGQLIGVDFVLNEFVAFGQLQGLLQGGAELQERSVVIGIYALATFANFGSVAMTIAGLGEIAPSRRQDLARLGMKAMLAGLLAALLTATFAGMLT